MKTIPCVRVLAFTCCYCVCYCLLLSLLVPSSLQISSPNFPPPDDSIPISNGIHEDEPDIVEAVPNVTVAVGRDAKIPCLVKNLGSYRVAWLRVESKTILTIHHHIITRNYRIGLSHSDDRHWNLHITDVQETDRGGYMCQINTVPMKYQVGFLDVVVPPEITADTSSDVTVRENLNVTLKCGAKGYPRPTIKWRREDGKPIEFGNWQDKKSQGIDPPEVYEGDTITITKVSRLHMGAYLAIVPPMIWVPNQLIGVAIGVEAVLQCNTEAFPVSLNYWTKDDEDTLMQSEKYDISNTEKSYKVHMVLRIKEISADDFGTYKCFARNALGSTEGSIKLYEVHLPTGRSGARRNSLKIQSLEVETTDRGRHNNIKSNDNVPTIEGSSGNRKESQLRELVIANSGSSSSFIYLHQNNLWASSLLVIASIYYSVHHTSLLIVP